jgi:phospholipid/cholesterol/gamma-HCH transport system permease protein
MILLKSRASRRRSTMIAHESPWFGRWFDFLAFVGRACGWAPWAVVCRFPEFIRQFEHVAVRSLPIVLGAGLSVGLVAWLQTHRLLVAHGAESTLPSFLAVAVVVEIGPILAGLLVAARMGAGLAAELSSMILNEEIDARIVLGADPVPTLVAPRAIACALAVPLLTVLIDASALLGSLAAELTAGRSNSTLFWNKTLVFLRLSDVVPATLKTAIFGLVVGMIACWTGLNAERSTEAVGHAAIRGVVRSILGVFAANVVMVPGIQFVSDVLG